MKKVLIALFCFFTAILLVPGNDFDFRTPTSRNTSQIQRINLQVSQEITAENQDMSCESPVAENLRIHFKGSMEARYGQKQKE